MSDLTKQAILQAFLKLLSEKPFDKITVSALADTCHITRRTFYYHFEDLYDLIKYMLQAEFQDAVEEFLNSDEKSWEESFISVSHFILENKKAVYHLYNSAHRDEMEQYIAKLATETIDRYLDRIAPVGKIDPHDKHLIASFYINALTGIVKEWLDGGMKEDPEMEIRRLGKLFYGNLQRSVDMSAK